MMNVFKIKLGVHHFPKGIFPKIKLFFKKIKWAYQRITRGFCDYDLYELDEFYKKLISNTLYEFAKKIDCNPDQFEYFEDWQNALENASNEFKYSINDKPNVYDDELFKRLKQDGFQETEQFQELCQMAIHQQNRDERKRQFHFEKGLNFLKKYNQHLWY